MAVHARFVHANIVAKDWRRLASFYQQVFGCTPIPPERNLSGPWLEQATGVRHAEIKGIHLQLPGYSEGGPTLEISQYADEQQRPHTAINRPGFAHIAFAVDDVYGAKDEVIACGGNALGEVVSAEVPGVGTITLVYVTDPEGNIIELQKWIR